MFLIATDEAGYGPKLGPLVIVATAWKLPVPPSETDRLQPLFSKLTSPASYGDLVVTVDDSKRVFRQGEGLELLHAIVDAGMLWCRAAERGFPELLNYLCPDDVAEIHQTRWLKPDSSVPPADEAMTRFLVDHWSGTGLELTGARARVISPRRMNDAFDKGFNKADLLSSITLELVRDVVLSLPDSDKDVAVYCDRHGGRRYYAGPLQHSFPDGMLQVMSESKTKSSYRLHSNQVRLDVHFTVKGDQFAPVAFSSLIAKYLRERMMESFNSFFARRYRGDAGWKPTAGYPVDADRFLQQVASIRQQENLADTDLIRRR